MSDIVSVTQMALAIPADALSRLLNGSLSDKAKALFTAIYEPTTTVLKTSNGVSWKVFSWSYFDFDDDALSEIDEWLMDENLCQMIRIPENLNEEIAVICNGNEKSFFDEVTIRTIVPNHSALKKTFQPILESFREDLDLSV